MSGKLWFRMCHPIVYRKIFILVCLLYFVWSVIELYNARLERYNLWYKHLWDASDEGFPANRYHGQCSTPLCLFYWCGIYICLFSLLLFLFVCLFVVAVIFLLKTPDYIFQWINISSIFMEQKKFENPSAYTRNSIYC